jgi:CMP/dCMP kinase
MIITIDGPAGAGKSTVARALARRLGFRFLDTGAMYRAVALAGMRQAVDWDRPEQLAELARRIELRVVGERIFLGGDDVTDTVRTSAVTARTRYAADNPEVRAHLVALQRAAAAGENIVTEGRDQGTVAFPDAQCKILLTASATERAKRRLQDLAAQGESADLAEVLSAIERRDHEDSARPVGALVPAADAITVCTDGLTIEEVVDHLHSLAKKSWRLGLKFPENTPK